MRGSTLEQRETCVPTHGTCDQPAMGERVLCASDGVWGLLQAQHHQCACRDRIATAALAQSPIILSWSIRRYCSKALVFR